MADESSRDSGGILAKQRLERSGLEVKLDKGFSEGTYCIYCEFDDVASRAGFVAAQRKAVDYCALFKEYLGQTPGYVLGVTKDGSRTGDTRRKHDLESTFLWFTIKTDDGRFHDNDVRQAFQAASLRASQAWDQTQARLQEKRRDLRQEKFQARLASLFAGPAYAQLDSATKERLLHEIPALAYAPRGLER